MNVDSHINLSLKSQLLKLCNEMSRNRNSYDDIPKFNAVVCELSLCYNIKLLSITKNSSDHRKNITSILSEYNTHRLISHSQHARYIYIQYRYPLD